MRRRQDQDGMADAPHSPSVEYVSLLFHIKIYIKVIGRH